MSQYKGRELSSYVDELLEGADERDAIILATDGWLKSAGVVLLKQHTDINLYRTTLWWRSMNAESAKAVKAVIIEYYATAYSIDAISFMQSPEERRMTKADCLYFHAIIQICDFDVRKSAEELKQAHGL